MQRTNPLLPVELEEENGRELSPKREHFAQVWAATGNQSAAYRQAYKPAEHVRPASIWAMASQIAALPQVAARYEELRQIALNNTVITIRDALQWQYDIATADPNELIRTVTHNCRYCHGFGFGYQWKDDDEFIDACVNAIDNKVVKKSPVDTGGYGFDPMGVPHPGCPHCYGAGVPITLIADTTKLEGKARKLYAGVETDRFGVIKIKMHDQQAAWEKVCRMMGAFNDKLDLRTPAERAAAETRNKMPENVTVEDAARAYQSLLSVS